MIHCPPFDFGTKPCNQVTRRDLCIGFDDVANVIEEGFHVLARGFNRSSDIKSAKMYGRILQERITS